MPTIAILLLGLGLLLVAAELLFPSFGVLGVLAAAAIIGAIATAFGESNQAGISFLIATAVLLPTVAIIALKLLPRSPMGRFLVNKGLSFSSQAVTDSTELELLGQQGVVESDLRPAGIARIAERRIDVISRGDLIARGERVKVVEVSGNRIVVARADGTQ